MTRRNITKVTWTLLGRTIEFSRVPATSARNWDGTPAGDGNDPNKIILQRVDWRNGENPRYTNWW